MSLPPVFLLPWRAARFNSTITTISPSRGIEDTTGVPEALRASGTSQFQGPRPLSATKTTAMPVQSTTLQATSSSSDGRSPTAQPTPFTTVPLTDSVRTLLPRLYAQRSHYITAHIHARPYVLTEGDTLRLPFLMHGVKPGDILRLNRAANIGSRDYTLKGAPYLDERLFECRARVMGVESEPMRIMEKTKRRQRRVKTVKSKMRYTILRVSELRVKSLEELDGGQRSE